jgi:hypothetical protein
MAQLFPQISPEQLQVGRGPNLSAFQRRFPQLHGLLGSPGGGGLLGNQDLAMALLANSGYGPKRSFGQVLGTSMQQAQQMGQERADIGLDRRLKEAQIRNYDEPNRGRQSPSSVQEYEYAKQNGFNGSFQDWVVAGGQSSRPSSVQEWEFYNALPDDKKPLYLEMKRNPNWKVADINEVPTVIQGKPGGAVETTALSTLPKTVDAASQLKRAESEAGAVGTGSGQVQAGITKKGSDAKSTMNTLDLADPLIDAATGSMVGAGRDKLAAAFGVAPTGAQAIAQLQVLQASLMTSMPRMEGPQSDKDVELYRQAAGQLGDPNIPSSIKKAAVKTIRALQQKYVDRAAAQDGGGTARKRYNPATGKIE